jgi:hypothetical protein
VAKKRNWIGYELFNPTAIEGSFSWVITLK